jgi:hypothetical protein
MEHPMPSLSKPSPHQITTHMQCGIEFVTCGVFSASHRTDALRRLCRAMVATGLVGPAEVRSQDGSLRLLVHAIESAARFTLSETDARGLHLRPYREWTGPRAADMATEGGVSRPTATDLPASA